MPPEPAAVSKDEVRSRRLSTEEVIRNQWDRLNEIRNDTRRRDRVEAWAESIETLHDALYPWWRDNQQFKERWEAREVTAVRLPNGALVAMPTALECREAQRLLIELMDDAGLLVKRRNVSGPAEREFAKAEAPVEVPA